MKIFLLIVISIFISSCDEGITPDPITEEAGFSGTVTFSGTWPDSVQRTHIVVFRDPLLSPADFNILNLSFVSEAIPADIFSFTFNSADSALLQITPGTYSYIAVAQSKTPELSLNRPDWYVIGVYYTGNDSSSPGKLIIPENTMVRNINIHCDFNNLPPQPPGG